MDLFLATSQGTGLALATGIRPFLPPLLAGALARADLGLDFEGTGYAFLESVPFLAAMVLVTVVATAGGRLGLKRALVVAVPALAVVLGALEFAGSLADEDYAGAPGLAGGAVLALVGFAAAAAFLARAGARVRARVEGDPTSYLAIYADAAALCLAGLAVLVPPVSYLALTFCAWILIVHRRRAGRKYEGLRVLR